MKLLLLFVGLLLTQICVKAQINFADEETPSGVIDGVNARFFLAHTPNPFSSVVVFKDGLRQKKCLVCDLTVFMSGTRPVILFNPCCIPKPGDTIVVDYRWGTIFTGVPCSPPGTTGAGVIVYTQLPDGSCLPLVAISNPGGVVSQVTASWGETDVLGQPVTRYQYMFTTVTPAP